MIVDGKKMKTDTQKKAGVLRHLQDLFYNDVHDIQVVGIVGNLKAQGFMNLAINCFPDIKFFLPKRNYK